MSTSFVIFLTTMSLMSYSITTRAYAPDMDIIEVIDPYGKMVDGMTQRERAAKIDAYFAQWNLPLAGYGMTFVQAADQYEHIDWRLLAAIGMRESTGCKFAFAQNNCFGWGRRVTFSSKEEAIYRITAHLAGEIPSTAYYYAGKDTQGILRRYNSVIPTYTKEIFTIMDRIENMPVEQSRFLAAQ
ncbi:MAG: hypothetical protein LRY42_02020 [Candidatus Pacebacteria bacterium]|nr:hypothetical protein [Candidatus Paceibacterota bacterium]